jgi:hypothetical protein
MGSLTVSKTITGGIERSIILAKVMGVKLPKLSEYRGLLEAIDKVEKNRGKLNAIKLWKYWYNCMCRKAMNETNIHEKPTFWMRLSKSGYPQILKPYLEWVSSEKNNVLYIRLILTAFRSHDLAKVAPVRDFQTITSDSSGTACYERDHRRSFKKFLSYSSLARDFRKDFRTNIDKVVASSKGKIRFHYTTKSGVSGSALGTAGLQSLYFIEDKQMEDLLFRLSDYFYKEDNLESIIRTNQKFYQNKTDDVCKPKDLNKILKFPGHISFIPDNGGKTRVVGIGNYWIQNTLKPLHDALFRTLRHIAMDGTYDQISQASRVAHATTQGPVWSFDLTAATDRIPIIIQQDVMSFLSPVIGDLWSKLLRSMIFENQGKGYKYAVGQPMGLYSSWASLATVHHFIIQYCAWRIGLNGPFLQYAVLGDDVAIWNKPVAEEYQRIMSDLDVSISEAKSYIPSKDGPYKAEFAKRIFYNGQELSGISPAVLKQGLSSIWALPELVTFLVRHGFAEMAEIPISRILEILSVKPKDFKGLVLAFRINSLLGGPSLKEEDVTLADEEIPSYTLQDVMEKRIESLSESVDIYSQYVYYEKDEDRVELENLLTNGEVPRDLCINRVMADRIQQMLELQERMICYALPDLAVSFNEIKAKDEIEYEDNILTKIKDIEYIPSIRFKDLKEGLTLHKDKKQYRVLFLKRLVKRLLTPVTEEVW